MILVLFRFGVFGLSPVGGEGTAEGIEGDDTFNKESVQRSVALVFSNNASYRKDYIRVDNWFAIHFSHDHSPT